MERTTVDKPSKTMKKVRESVIIKGEIVMYFNAVRALEPSNDFYQ